MAKLADPQQTTPPFFKFPGEIRNSIYRYCLGIEVGKKMSLQEFFAKRAGYLSHTFDANILGVCHQTLREASAVIKERLKLYFHVEHPQPVWICGDNGIKLEPSPTKVPTQLQQILPYASVLPVRDLEIRMQIGSKKYTDRELWESVYKIRIHQISETLQRFPALETVHIQFLRLQTPEGQFNLTPHRFCRGRILECFGRFRGFKKVSFEADTSEARCAALKRAMQRPRLLGEEDDVSGEVLECRCERQSID
ncbi:MAG: hypothetical protein Q9225_000565 [Loekoesia sp. 1 TL-2023]